MWVYKITNIQNGKVYIGQTVRPVKKRFNRHINDAINCKLDTHFARAIRKYGKDSFIVEIIDSASSQDELNQKERYWIHYYNSVQNGYNETDAVSKRGGNTYQSKTKKEIANIANKIRVTKTGQLNPMARRIKRINVKTNEVDIFDTVIECAKKCGINSGKTSIMSRLNGNVKTPFKGFWIFEYCDK